MASRLKTRISAGAAVLTGLGMVGIAAAAPAQADTVTQNFECTYTVLNVGEVPGDKAVTVDMTVDLPATAEVGDTINPAVTATVTIPEERRDSLYGLLGVRTLDGPNAADAAADDQNKNDARNQANVKLSDGTDSVEGPIPLSLPKTDVPDNGALVVQATGAVEPVSVEQAGTYTVDAGDFQAYIRGYAENGDYTTNVTLDCTNISEATEIGAIEVTDGDGDDNGTDPAVEPSDWFTEPDSLPITEDGKHFTVEGTATRAGILNVVLLDSNKKVLKTTPWDATEGANKQDFPFAEGTDYVRLISENCVDAKGNDESVVGSDCNVEYYAPWVNPDGDDAKPEPEPELEPGDDATPEKPEVPGVVQTDGFAQAGPEADNTATLALGGLLLAGVGVGVVVVARRRQVAQH